MLAHIKTLSLWEIAHYWHGADPRKSTTHNIPLAVRDTLLVLSRWCGNSVSYRVEKDNALRYDLAQQLPRFTARHYRHAFQKAIDSKVFGKRFFSGMYIARSYLARMCIQHNEQLPIFWFPDNEKYPFKLEGDISDEITEDGRFRLALIYDDRKPSENKLERSSGETVTVKDHLVKAAQASHAPINEIKARFIRFFEVEGQSFASKRAAAISFFDSLHERQEKLLFSHKDAAVRTLLDALRAHEKQRK